jgi:hypothetical protein
MRTLGRSIPLTALLALTLTGCAGSSVDWGKYDAPLAGAVGSALILSESSLNIDGGVTAAGGDAAAGGGAGAASSATSVSHTALLRQLGGAALIAYALYDPFEPNWRIQVLESPDAKVARIRMNMRTLTTGGQGEAYTVFRRAAQEIVTRRGATGFEILSYEEGVHSTRPLAQRYAVGEVRLWR